MNKKINETIKLLKEEYPDAKCELNYATPFQLLVATIMSAQTTDVKVNEITKVLFQEYPDLDRFLTLSQNELENKIKKIGLYRNKAKNILTMCHQLKDDFGGEVPATLEELISLAGVGRKTANVVLSNAFNIPAIAVDTHVFRVSNRIGLVQAKDVLETEKQLQRIANKEDWNLLHHLLIFHGRRCCSARKPNCAECKIQQHCDFYH
ncbi:endonuclease III [Clostridium aceticum]|uniref:Endonuclease III n=1 Tax=Clostridium aceticum TaxID=84022 RepID=A0A0D8IDF8_9CLOT|nr:endonuclease III [Clostridium aceticum]AKL94455.1 endonuclease III [Clostridium aceticum]KJF28325.1 endonuclease III [Clostridium aceticum]